MFLSDINMIRQIKYLITLGIFISMFIPLSKCTYDPVMLDSTTNDVPIKELEQEARAGTRTQVLIISEKFTNMGVLDLWVPLTFVLPIFFAIPYSRTAKKFYSIHGLQSLYSLWLLYFVYLAVYSYYQPLPGGYLLTLLAILYLVVTTLEWYQFLKKHNQ